MASRTGDDNNSSGGNYGPIEAGTVPRVGFDRMNYGSCMEIEGVG